MSSVDVKNLYNVGLNGKGYVFMGSPGSPAYQRSVIPTEINRLAISDINYSDFSGTGLFYIAQTDWSAGIKNEKIWKDDAKFYYSTNIDAYSEQGAIKCAVDVAIEGQLGASIYTMVSGLVDGTGGSHVDQYFAGGLYGGNVAIYENYAGTFNNITGTDFGTEPIRCNELIIFGQRVWALNNSDTNNVGVIWQGYYTGGAWAWTDKSATIAAATTLTYFNECRCGVYSPDGTLYLGLISGSILFTIIYTINGTSFTELFTGNKGGAVTDMVLFYDKLYYLIDMYGSNRAELRACDPTDGSEVLVRSFDYSSFASTGCGNKLLAVYGGKLIITMPPYQIYEFDGTNVTKIYQVDTYKYSIGKTAIPYLAGGAVEYNERLHWGNLIYDGEAFYNNIRPSNDSTSTVVYPFGVDDSNLLWTGAAFNPTGVFLPYSLYKPTLSNNYLVFNEMSPVVSIDKILHSATIMFDKLAANEEMKVEYSIDNMSTWVNISGTMTVATEGTSSTKREIIVPGNIVFNKIWWRVYLKGTTTTPVVRDFIMSYKPIPDYKNKWQATLNTSNNFRLLNNQYEERSGAELNAELWNVRQLKQKVVF